MENELKKYLVEKNYTNFDLQAVLFDMDGVLYDSMKYHAKSWYEAMSENNIPSTPEEFYMHEGRTGDNTIKLLIERNFNRPATDSEIESIYNRKSELFTKYNQGDTIPFAYEMLKAVKAKQLECILVTGSGQPSLLDKLEINFPHIFEKDKMVTAFNVKHGKPHPEPYLKGLEKAGNLHPNQAIVVENAPMGVESAVAAGIFTVAVNTGPLPDKVLSDAGANIVFPSMESLFENWEELYKTFSKK